MKFNISDLNEGETDFSFEGSGDELGFNKKEQNDIKIISVISISLKVYKIEEKIVSFFSLSGKAELICVRCLECYVYPFDTDFEVEYRRRASTSTRLSAVGGSLLKSQSEKINKDVVEYSGDIIDIRDDVKQNIILALPMKPVCSFDCKGLCSICGNNLNLKECGCKRRM